MKRSFSTEPLHVAIIMDGNGRWARRRGLPRTAGHQRGAQSVRRVLEAAPSLDIERLTLYAFSSDNWKRPATEVRTLMELLRSYLREEVQRCVEEGIRVTFIGRRDRLEPALRQTIARAERETAPGHNLHLRIALDYSARQAILEAAAGAGQRPEGLRDFERHLAPDIATGGASPRVDLLIRTGGEQRLSDFLLWECAYAELYFTPVAWPDFGADDLERAVAAYRRRQRRFGALPDESGGSEEVAAAV